MTMLAIGAAAVVLAGALVGCTASPAVPPQTVVDFTRAAQSGTPTVVQIPVGGKLGITPPNPAYLEPSYWSASIANPVILTFAPANGSGRAASLPLFTGVEKGETTAVLTYTGGATPARATFEITVAEP